MREIQLNRNKKIILTIGAMLLCIALLYRIMPVFQGLTPDGGEMELKAQKIAKYQRQVANKSNLEKKRLHLTRRLERIQKYLLAAETPALAAVIVQNRLNEIADGIHVNINSLRVLKPVAFDQTHYVSIPVNFSVDLSIRKLKTLVYRVEHSPLSLRITGLRLRDNSSRKPGEIQATMTVAGLFEKKQSEPS